MQPGHFFPSILWALIILLASTLPGSELPKTQIPGIDKFIHILFYVVLVFLLQIALVKQFIFSSKRYYAGTISASISFFYGVFIEMLQYHLIDGRSFEILDVLANGIGCLLGIIIFKLVYYKITD